MPDPAAAPVDPAVARDIAAIARIAAVPKILQAVAHVTGLRFTAVARVTDCSWTACAVHDDLDFGMVPGTELALETTLCNEIRKHGQPIMFDQASAHPIFSKHPTPALYGFESYVSIPILRADGSFFGTLCALDPRPARLDDPDTLRTLELFAELISAQLEADDRLQRSEGELLVAEDNAKLREQFIAVLGHDLRSPLQALAMGTELLRVAPLHAKWGKHLDRMEDSCLRMGEMIGDILDFARGRLGGGIPVQAGTGSDLSERLQQVIAEACTAHPQRGIDVHWQLERPVHCDAQRLGQLLANLLDNALKHGLHDRPISVSARSDAQQFRLAVANHGPVISAEIQSRLFEPFWRARTAQGAPEPAAGLGLGLYIASEIAKAHGGTLSVSSLADAGTCFELRMPTTPQPALP